MLSRLRTRIAAPIVAQLERALASALADVEQLRGALYVAESDRDSYREHAQRWLAEATLVRRERDTLQARLEALTPKPALPLPEDRRRAILDAVRGFYEFSGQHQDPTAEAVADWIRAQPPECLMKLSDASIMRFVSRLAAEGYLVSDGGKPMRYRLSESGRADLAVAA